MLQFSARRFFWASSALEKMRGDCLLASVPEAGNTRIILSRSLDEIAVTNALMSLEHIEREFRALGLLITAETVEEVLGALKSESHWKNFQWLMDQVATIHKLADKEMRGKKFFYVPAERAKFFPAIDNQYIFGPAVGRAFPSALYDIQESGFCLALGRGTACVFHLMRALEVALTVFADVFSVSSDRANWQNIIEQIEKEIRDFAKTARSPEEKERREFYAQAASNFMFFKDAWRNYTAHARGKYTEEEAERHFENVKAFMQKLAERLSE